MTVVRLLAVMLLIAAPRLALAQSSDADQAQPTSDAAPPDPVEALQGVWHVDHVEGAAAADGMAGGLLQIDRQAITTLSAGTCSLPGFAVSNDASSPDQVRVDVSCLGQELATATWSTANPNSVAWAEPRVQAVLHRVIDPSATPPPASDDQGGSDTSGGDAGEDDSE